MSLTKKQLGKVAEQLRLLSWAQGAILTSTSGFKLPLDLKVMVIIMGLWIFLQSVALVFDKGSE